MHQHISLIIVCLTLLVFSSDIYTYFLSSPPEKNLSLIYAAACMLITVILLLLPVRILLQLYAFSATIIIFPAFFYRGSLIEKTVVAIILYLFSMVADMISSLAGYIGQLLFTTVPVSGNIFLTGTPAALIIYSIIFPLTFLLFRHFILPHFKFYLNIFGTAFFFRITGPFLLVYLVSNGFLLLVQSHSVLLFAGLSFAFFFIMGLLSRYTLESFHFFLEIERKHTHLELQKKQLELIMEHTKKLSDKYTDIRRLNHDISAHLTALSHLIHMGKWSDSLDYISRLTHQKEHHL